MTRQKIPDKKNGFQMMLKIWLTLHLNHQQSFRGSIENQFHIYLHWGKYFWDLSVDDLRRCALCGLRHQNLKLKTRLGPERDENVRAESSRGGLVPTFFSRKWNKKVIK